MKDMNAIRATTLLSALVVRHSLAEFSWASFGENSACKLEVHTNGSRTSWSLQDNQTYAETLEKCKGDCQQQEDCYGMEYHSDGRCILLSQAIQYKDPILDSECWQLQRSSAIQKPKTKDVFIMLPLRLVSNSGILAEQEYLDILWQTITTSGADGFMVDVWWGITEPFPGHYNFSAYRQIIDQAKQHGFKVQVVSSFHRCGGNVGDDCYIPLPAFLTNASGIWYKDAEGNEDQEYISLFADRVDVAGRTPLRMYSDWLNAFASEFSEELGSTIVEVMVGLGPCGELRYPNTALAAWKFPGIGEFQCYDEHALASLQSTALAAGRKDFARPPSRAMLGNRTRSPSESEFFKHGYATVAGRFFLEWYSSSLRKHAEEILAGARKTFGNRTKLTAKVGGFHWWYNTHSHAAEMTAGYYNTNGQNAYEDIAATLKKAGTDVLDFTCLEMRDAEQPSHSSPESLVWQVHEAAARHGLLLSGENALARYDEAAYQQIFSYEHILHSVTYLRLSETLVQYDNLQRFKRFVTQFHGEGRKLHESHDSTSSKKSTNWMKSISTSDPFLQRSAAKSQSLASALLTVVFCALLFLKSP